MNHSEEQETELEALREIYFNEINVISDKTPITLSIKVHVEAPASDWLDAESVDSEEEDLDDEDEDEVPGGTCVDLLFKLPPRYPEEAPSIKVINPVNLDECHLSDLSKHLDNKAQECLGDVMVMTLVSETLEWLLTRSDREPQEVELEGDQKEKDLDAVRQFDGTPVTKQSFLAWKARFDAELVKIQLEQQKALVEQNSTNSKKLTEDLDQDQIEALLQNIDELEIEDGFEVDVDDEDMEDEDYLEDEDDNSDDDNKQR